jgi:hypothetical protein
VRPGGDALERLVAAVDRFLKRPFPIVGATPRVEALGRRLADLRADTEDPLAAFAGIQHLDAFNRALLERCRTALPAVAAEVDALAAAARPAEIADVERLRGYAAELRVLLDAVFARLTAK